MTKNTNSVSDNVRSIAHLDLPGAGQVYVAGNYCYVDHIPNAAGLGTALSEETGLTDGGRQIALVNEKPVSRRAKYVREQI